MPARSMSDRIEILEQKVEDLQRLPERVTGLETQILQLRSELGVEFSAIRERFDEVLAQLREGDEESRRFARTLHEEVLTRMQAGDEETRRLAQTLHEEVLTRMQAGDEETQSQMRVLHEDVINRFALLQEGLPAPRRKREGRKRK